MNKSDQLCPKCATSLDKEKPWIVNQCPKCAVKLAYCWSCGKLGELIWLHSDDTPEKWAECTYCSEELLHSRHTLKSWIYRSYLYAFKFDNGFNIGYPTYFDGPFPFGEIVKDLGIYGNEFRYADALESRMDWGTSRAYKVLFDLDGQQHDCIVLTHETGLEVFLLAAAAFVGGRVAEFALTKALEKIESSINSWWKHKKAEGKAFVVRHRQEKPEENLVKRILVRTPYWEISVDGEFSEQDRQWLFDLLSQTIPSESTDQLIERTENEILSQKVLKATRKVKRIERY